MFLKTLFKSIPKDILLVKEVHAAHKPSIFYAENRWRHKNMGKTLDYIFDPHQFIELEKQSQSNLNQWTQEKIPLPHSVEVSHKDWGLATFEATKKHGVLYSVLNMANSIFPGGAALQGGSAQEENIWNRSTAARTLLDKNIYFDKDSNTFRYNETVSKLLEAKIKMTAHESQAIGEPGIIPYKVLFLRTPSICFRGPEVPLITSGFDTYRSIADKKESFSFLPKSDVFPFYELRSAAPDLSSELYTMEGQVQYIDDLRRRIAAQLDTLILEKQRHVILGAWGCGEFKNDPELVAQIYSEEIEKRADLFDHIVFAILNTNSQDNFTIFAEQLNGMKLGTHYADTTLKCKE
ncbi:hypothetical protein Lsan_3499 [Legionella santicrucis]|uniref:Microbial-type PARG catalytic domain-containing protein n=1 Tax=Legionella santicrucis TaxID=45074 RepID=A0A0W0YAA2_9GAMM|nr:poly(ADP-ribose) glycohydrolase domain-containing protein [Legionella santicrucis]KTD53835.1 hypothetical protein Lsan_3499 [Legionella santicrucis]